MLEIMLGCVSLSLVASRVFFSSVCLFSPANPCDIRLSQSKHFPRKLYDLRSSSRRVSIVGSTSYLAVLALWQAQMGPRIRKPELTLSKPSAGTLCVNNGRLIMMG